MFEQNSLLNPEAQKPEINLAPFVDIILILLIFFVVTANMYVVTGLTVSKPKAQAAKAVGQKALIIGITREGAVQIYGRQVSPERLQNIIAQEVARMPDVAVVIVADQNTPVGKAVLVMDKCVLAGAAKVSIAAEKE